jgi:hypothetical protein
MNGPIRRNVDAALKSLGLPSRYRVVDQATLADDDMRRGYPITYTALQRPGRFRYVGTQATTA